MGFRRPCHTTDGPFRHPRTEGSLTGVLVHSIEGCAYQIRYLLTHPEFARQLGEDGREHVRENFLITTNAKRYLVMFQVLLGMVPPLRSP